MQITVIIDNCRQCRHVGHSGSFTVRGPRDICGHPDASKKRRSKSNFYKMYPEYRGDVTSQWSHHWYHRIVDNGKGKVKGIPDWCPLKHGAGY